MRQIGTLPKSLDPKVFADYLLTLGIKTRVDEQPEGWNLWIYNEDHIARARDELQSYVSRPDDPRYREAVDAAQAIRQKASSSSTRSFARTIARSSDLWAYPGFRRRPLTIALVAICVVVFLLQQSPVQDASSRRTLCLRDLLRRPARTATRQRPQRHPPRRSLAAGDADIHARECYCIFSSTCGGSPTSAL